MPRNGPRKLDVPVADQRRAQVMRAVIESIAAEGLERTTMRNVAERAGVSTGTIAYYFKSKKEMIDAALLEASREYMERFYRERRADEPLPLDELVERFLAADNPNAGFVLQMIEVGLHNPRLRSIHQWMVETGRSKIEAMIRLGMEKGRFRAGIDPKLAAAMVHGVLIWWGSEMMSNATSQELARRVARFAVGLLENVPAVADPEPRQASVPGNGSRRTPESIRALLLADPALPEKTAQALADAIEKLYEAVDARESPLAGSAPATGPT